MADRMVAYLDIPDHQSVSRYSKDRVRTVVYQRLSQDAPGVEMVTELKADGSMVVVLRRYDGKGTWRDAYRLTINGPACPKCGDEVTFEGSRATVNGVAYHSECLPFTCPRCGFVNLPESTLCHRCGKDLCSDDDLTDAEMEPPDSEPDYVPPAPFELDENGEGE